MLRKNFSQVEHQHEIRVLGDRWEREMWWWRFIRFNGWHKSHRNLTWIHYKQLWASVDWWEICCCNGDGCETGLAAAVQVTGEREREGGCDGNDDGIQAVFASAVRVILKPHPRYSTSWILGHWRTGERDVVIMVVHGCKTDLVSTVRIIPKFQQRHHQ